MKKFENFEIHSYKHNKKIHKTWDEAVLLEETNDYIVCANNETIVLKADNRVWKTKEPAIMFFYKENWFNVIAQIKTKGIYYYCNIATPYILDGNLIKYIDYDLDLRVFPDGAYKILDKSEYAYHKKKMNYGDDLDLIIKTEMKNLIKMVVNKEYPFNSEIIQKYYEEYKTYKNQNK